MKERNSSRCVTELLHHTQPTHARGRTHTHAEDSRHTLAPQGTRRGPVRAGAAPRARSGNTTHTRQGVSPPTTQGEGTAGYLCCPCHTQTGGAMSTQRLSSTHTRPYNHTFVYKHTHTFTHSHLWSARTTQSHRPSVLPLESLKPTEPQDLGSGVQGPVSRPSPCPHGANTFLEAEGSHQCVPRESLPGLWGVGFPFPRQICQEKIPGFIWKS